MSSDRFTRPPGLRPGDRIAVVAPASAFDRASFEAGLAVLAARYRPVFDPGCFARTRYLAGDDSRRLDELTAALADDSVKAIVAARGGYGTLRLLADLWPKLRAAAFPPKPVVGFSDLTALHAVLQAAGWVSIHGPVVTQLGAQPPAVAERLVHLLESPVAPAPLRGTPLAAGVVEGPLLGGNLSLVTRLLGTRYLPDLDGAILLLEDVGERPYRLDRLLTQLRQAGVFERIAGLVFGTFMSCPVVDGVSPLDVVRSCCADLPFPVAFGLPAGHQGEGPGIENLALPLGVPVALDTMRNRLVALEPAVA